MVIYVGGFVGYETTPIYTHIPTHKRIHALLRRKFEYVVQSVECMCVSVCECVLISAECFVC